MPNTTNKVSEFGDIFSRLLPGPTTVKTNKVTIVGVGSVGMAAAFSIMSKSLTHKLVLYDINTDLVEGEVLDMQHCSQYLDSCDVSGGSDIEVTAESDIIFITASVRQTPGESRHDLVQRNYEVFKKIIPDLVMHSPNCILVVVSNPVDILTYITWKLSGFPEHRVMGSGTLLDSARFRYMLGRKLNVNSSSIQGYVIGEHGDSSVPVWSTLSVGGIKLSDSYPKMGTNGDPNGFDQVHKDVVRSAYEIIKRKGYTSWAIGLCCASLCQAILQDRDVILPITTSLKGMFGLTKPTFISIPSVVNASGVSSVIKLKLSQSEENTLLKSINALEIIIGDLN